MPSIDRSKVREGEGAAIDVDVHLSGDGSLVNAGIDVFRLPAPSRRFASDLLSVKVDVGVTRLLFGQTDPVSGHLLNLLVVNLSPECIESFKDSVGDEFYAPVFQPTSGVELVELVEFSAKAEHTHILTCTLMFVACNQNEAALDFYYFSPFARQQIQFTKKLAIEPIVRVTTTTGAAIAMVAKLAGKSLQKDSQ